MNTKNPHLQKAFDRYVRAALTGRITESLERDMRTVRRLLGDHTARSYWLRSLAGSPILARLGDGWDRIAPETK